MAENEKQAKANEEPQRHFAAHVAVTNPETGLPVAFVPGEEVPEWARPLVTNEAALQPINASGTTIPQPGTEDYPAVGPSQTFVDAQAVEHGVRIGDATGVVADGDPVPGATASGSAPALTEEQERMAQANLSQGEQGGGKKSSGKSKSE